MLIAAAAIAIAALVLRTSNTCQCQCPVNDVSTQLSHLLRATNDNHNSLTEVNDLITECEDKIMKNREDIATITQALEDAGEATIQINATLTQSIESLQSTISDLTGDTQQQNCTTSIEETCTIPSGLRTCTTRQVPYQKPQWLAVDVTCKTLDGSRLNPLVTTAIVNGNTISCQCNTTETFSEDNTPRSSTCGLCVTRCL